MNKTFMSLMAALILGSGFAEASTTTKLPNDVLGSSVLVIHQSYRLLIGGHSTELLAKELGAKKRQQFFFDMILEKDLSYLKKTYGAPSHPEAIKAIEQYAGILSNITRMASNTKI